MIGADITFLEAPESKEEMRAFCDGVAGWKMANMLEGGVTPSSTRSELDSMGFKLAAYPFALLNAQILAMQDALENLKRDEAPQTGLRFEELQSIVGFSSYFEEEQRYASPKKRGPTTDR